MIPLKFPARSIPAQAAGAAGPPPASGRRSKRGRGAAVAAAAPAQPPAFVCGGSGFQGTLGEMDARPRRGRRVPGEIPGRGFLSNNNGVRAREQLSRLRALRRDSRVASGTSEGRSAGAPAEPPPCALAAGSAGAACAGQPNHVWKRWPLAPPEHPAGRGASLTSQTCLCSGGRRRAAQEPCAAKAAPAARLRQETLEGGGCPCPLPSSSRGMLGEGARAGASPWPRGVHVLPTAHRQHGTSGCASRCRGGSRCGAGRTGAPRRSPCRFTSCCS